MILTGTDFVSVRALQRLVRPLHRVKMSLKPAIKRTTAKKRLMVVCTKRWLPRYEPAVPPMMATIAKTIANEGETLSAAEIAEQP